MTYTRGTAAAGADSAGPGGSDVSWAEGSAHSLLARISFPVVLAIYCLLGSASVLLLGSPGAVVPVALVCSIVVFAPKQMALAIFLISCSVNIPVLHIPPTQELAVRFNDLILVAFAIRLIIEVCLGVFRKASVAPLSYRRRLGFLLLTVSYAFAVALTGGFGAFRVDGAFLANLFLDVSREIAYVGIFFVFAWLVVDSQTRVEYLRILYLSIVAASLYIVAEYVGLAPSLWARLPSGWKTVAVEQFGAADIVGSFNRNHSQAGLMTCLGFALGLALSFSRPRRIRLSVVVIGQILLVVALVASRKRAAYVALIVEALVFLGLTFRSSVRARDVALVVGGFAIVVAVLGYLGVGRTAQEEVAAILGVGDIVSATGGRMVQWLGGVDYLIRNPERVVVGSGLMFEKEFGSATVAVGKRGGAHNQWLSVLVERGIVGLTALVAVFVKFVTDSWKGGKDVRGRSESRLSPLYSMALFAFLCGAGVFSMATGAFTVSDPTGSFQAVLMAVSSLVLLDSYSPDGVRLGRG